MTPDESRAEVSESFDRPDRPDPEDDPFACSICGQPLGEVDRVEGFDHCRSCRREHGPDEHTAMTDGGQEVSQTNYRQAEVEDGV